MEALVGAPLLTRLMYDEHHGAGGRKEKKPSEKKRR
jgi:hypothetical protein